MGLRNPWVILPVGLGGVLLVYVVLSGGMPGIHGVILVLLLVAGLTGPLFGAAHLGGEALSSRPFRRNLLALLAGPAIAAVLAGWLGHGRSMLMFAVVAAFMGVAACTVGALLASALVRHGRVEFQVVARSLWTLVLAGAVFCLSVPIGWGFQAAALSRARTWVEAVSAEVRAVERATGRPPPTLDGILDRLGPPPWPVASNGGYSAPAESGSFAFMFAEGDGMDRSWWVYDGRTGAWTTFSD